MILSNENYLPPPIQDIPVINLDENNLEKAHSNILSQDINIEDFSAYHEPTDNDCTLAVDDEGQEEKKKLKKLGVGYR